MGRNKDAKMKYIKKMVGYNNTKGWFVQIERRYKNKRYYIGGKLFSFSKFNGEVGALKEAIRYRNKLQSIFKPYIFAKTYQDQSNADYQFNKYIKQVEKRLEITNG